MVLVIWEKDSTEEKVTVRVLNHVLVVMLETLHQFMKMETMQNMIRHASSKSNVKDENATSSKQSTLCSNKYGTKSGKLQENACVSKSTERV